MAKNLMPQKNVITAVTALTLMWGTNWGLFPIAVREVSVWTFRSLSLLCAAALVLLIAHLRGNSLKVPKGERLPIVASSICYMFVWHIASTYAATLLPSGQAAVLGFTMPIWATLISWIVLGEKPSARNFIAVVLAGVGVGSLAIGSWNAYTNTPLGFICGLGAAFGWAIGTLILHRANLRTSAIVSTGWQLLLAGIPVTIIALLTGSKEFFMPSVTTLVVIGYITFIPMSLGNIAWFQIAKSLPASISGISTVMVPVMAMLTGAIFHQEPLGPMQLLAMTSSAIAVTISLMKD